MIEALVAMTITATAGAALLTSLGSAVGTSREVIHRSVGRGLAEQLMDEISAARFPTATSRRPSSRKSREGFDDLDDYNGWTDQPPTDRFGRPLGTEGVFRFGSQDEGLHLFSLGQWRLGGITRLPKMRCDLNFLSRFRREVTVERIEDVSNGRWRTTDASTPLRRVTIRVLHVDPQGRERTVYTLSRVFAYVPLAP